MVIAAKRWIYMPGRKKNQDQKSCGSFFLGSWMRIGWTGRREYKLLATYPRNFEGTGPPGLKVWAVGWWPTPRKIILILKLRKEGSDISKAVRNRRWTTDPPYIWRTDICGKGRLFFMARLASHLSAVKNSAMPEPYGGGPTWATELVS